MNRVFYFVLVFLLFLPAEGFGDPIPAQEVISHQPSFQAKIASRDHETHKPFKMKYSPGINRIPAEKIKIYIIAVAIFILLLFLIPGLTKHKYFKNTATAILVCVAIFSVAIHFMTIFKSEQKGHRPHYWDVYHWIVGSKYYKELGARNLYEATLIADREGSNKFKKFKRTRDPLTKRMYPIENVYTDENIKRVKAPFTPDRWDQFSKDVNYFKIRLKNYRWKLLFQDKGYNGSPFSSLVYGSLSSWIPINDVGIFIMTRVDLLFVIAALVGVYWAFGLRALSLSIIFLMTLPVVRARYLGGVFFQYDWFAALLLSACFIKKKQFKLSGAFLSYAALMKVFPVLFFAGPFFLGISSIWREKKIPTWVWQFFGSAAITILILFSISLVSHRAVERWGDFGNNMIHHHDSLSSMRSGFKYAMMHNPQITSRKHSHGYADPRRLDKLTWVNYGVLILVAGIFIFLCTRREMPPGQAMILGGILIYFFVVAIVYYYIFLLVFIMLFASELERKDSAIILSLFFLASLLSLLPSQWGIRDLYVRNIIFTFSVLVALLGVYVSVGYRYLSGGLIKKRGPPSEVASSG